MEYFDHLRIEKSEFGCRQPFQHQRYPEQKMDTNERFLNGKRFSERGVLAICERSEGLFGHTAHEIQLQGEAVIRHTGIAFRLETVFAIDFADGKCALLEEQSLMAAVYRFPRRRGKLLRSDEKAHVFILQLMEIIGRFCLFRLTADKGSCFAHVIAILGGQQGECTGNCGICKQGEKCYIRLAAKCFVKKLVDKDAVRQNDFKGFPGFLRYHMVPPWVFIALSIIQ